MAPEFYLVPNVGNRSEVVAISAVSAQSSVLKTTSECYVNVYASTECFMRMGENPTALSTGVDQLIPATRFLRVGPIPANYRLAFITSGAAGNVYITKEN